MCGKGGVRCVCGGSGGVRCVCGKGGVRCVCWGEGRSEVCVCGDPECIGVGNDSRGLPPPPPHQRPPLPSSPPLLLPLLTRDVPVFSH